MSTLWSKQVEVMLNPVDDKNALQEEMTVTLTDLRLSSADIQRLNLDADRKKHTFIRLQIEMDNALEEEKFAKCQAMQARLDEWVQDHPNQQWQVHRLIENNDRPAEPDYSDIAGSGIALAFVIGTIQFLLSDIILIVFLNKVWFFFMIGSFLWLLIMPCVFCLAAYFNYQHQLSQWGKKAPVAQNGWLLELKLDNIPETDKQLESLFPSNGLVITDHVFSKIDKPLKKFNFYLHRKNFESAFSEATKINDEKKQLKCFEDLLAHIKKQKNELKTKQFEEKIVGHLKKFSMQGGLPYRTIIESYMKLFISLGRERDAQDLNEKYSKKFHQKDAFYFRNEIWFLQLAIDKITAETKVSETEVNISKSCDEMKNKLEMLVINYKGQRDEDDPMNESSESKIADSFEKIFDLQYHAEENLFQTAYPMDDHSIFLDTKEANEDVEETSFYVFLNTTMVNCDQKIKNGYFKSDSAKKTLIDIQKHCKERMDILKEKHTRNSFPISTRPLLSFQQTLGKQPSSTERNLSKNKK